MTGGSLSPSMSQLMGEETLLQRDAGTRETELHREARRGRMPDAAQAGSSLSG